MNILIKHDENITQDHGSTSTLEIQAIETKVRLLTVLIAQGLKLEKTETLISTIKRSKQNKNRIQIKFGFSRLGGFLTLTNSVSFLPNKDKFRLRRRMFTREQLADLCIRGFGSMMQTFNEVYARQCEKN